MSGTSHLTVILDRSGSMGSIRNDVIGGFNQFLAEQREVDAQATLTLVQFDSGDPYEVLQHAQPLVGIPELTAATYSPRGSTPLYDALGRGIQDLDGWLAAQAEDQRPAKVLFVIVTDGEENSSREFRKAQILELIRQRTEQGWQFVFLSSDLTALRDAEDVGVQQSSSLAFDQSGQGIRAAFRATSQRSNEYRSGVRGNFEYEQADRQRADDPQRDGLLAQSFSLPSFAGKRVLVVGIGGGSDVVAATALAERIRQQGALEVLYGNTKKRFSSDVSPVSRFIGVLASPAVVPLTAGSDLHGSCAIDAAMPRGAQGSPLIFVAPEAHEVASFGDEVRGLRIDWIVAVDTGGDVLQGPAGGRDWRMLQALRQTQILLLLAVVGPGSDGAMPFDEMKRVVQQMAGAGTYRGAAAVTDVLPGYGGLSVGLPADRTPQIILGTLQQRSDSMVTVPRGSRPVYPASWLRSVLFFFWWAV